MKEITQRGDIILSSTSCITSSVRARPKARSTLLRSSPALRAASCRRSARRRSTSTASNLSDAALERRFQQIRVESRRWTTPCRSCAACATATRRTTAARFRRRARRRRGPLGPLHPGPASVRQGSTDRRGGLAHAHQDHERAAVPRARGRSRRCARTGRPRSRPRSSRRRRCPRQGRKLTQKKRELEENWRRRGQRRAARDRRGRDRRHRLDVDGHPCLQAHRAESRRS